MKASPWLVHFSAVLSGTPVKCHLPSLSEMSDLSLVILGPTVNVAWIHLLALNHS